MNDDATTRMLSVVSEALHVEPDAALKLHDHAALLPTLLATLILEMRAARPQESAPPRAPPSPERAFLRAVFDHYPEERWTAGSLIAWASAMSFERGRDVVHDAIVGIVPAGLSPERLGRRLCEIAQAGTFDGLALIADGQRDHVRAWRITDGG